MEIKNNTIYMNRGDEDRIPFKIPINKEKTEFYQFVPGDVVSFGLYEKKGYDGPALILKEIEIEKTTDVCYIPLASEDTRFAEIENKPVEYWYEISLNKTTVLGHKKDGARIFWLLPEGSEKKGDA